MVDVNSTCIEDEFIEAKNNWELEKLYVDLSLAKGKSLTPVEKKFLRGLLCGFSPAEIAKIVYHSRSSSTVRVYLSNGLYKYIEEMLSNHAGYSVKVKNWSRVTHLLEKAGYKKYLFPRQSIINPIKTHKEADINNVEDNKLIQCQDWSEAIDVNLFHGRTQELAQVQQWIWQQRCRLVAILGMGGIGKTAFSVKLAEKMQNDFEFVIWRSLRFAPSLEVLLNQLIPILSPNYQINNTATVESKISQLIDCLRANRCLLILDHLDSILGCGAAQETPECPTISAKNSGIKNASAELVSQIDYRQGYEEYGELIRKVGNSQHQSCLVFTSREKPQDIAVLEGETLPVRTLKLTGLSQQETLLILKAKGVVKTSAVECQILLDWYAGNPLFLKLVATAIQELFAGNIHEFIEHGTVVFGDIRRILDQQFNRLSQIEKHIMYWLALNQQSVSLRDLAKDIVPGLSPRICQRLTLEAIDLLQRRSLIERKASSFSSTPVLMEYIIERLIEENYQFSAEQDGYLFINHTMFAAQLKNSMGKMG